MADIDAQALAGSWTHMHEEDTADLMVFRRSDLPLPPARARTAIELGPAGDLRQLSPGADDRRTPTPGRWRLEGRELTLDPEGGSAQRYSVERVTDAELILHKPPD